MDVSSRKDGSYRSSWRINASRCATRRRSISFNRRYFSGKEDGRGGNRYLRKLARSTRYIGYQYNARRPSKLFRRASFARIISRSGYLNEELGAQPPEIYIHVRIIGRRAERSGVIYIGRDISSLMVHLEASLPSLPPQSLPLVVSLRRLEPTPRPRETIWWLTLTSSHLGPLLTISTNLVGTPLWHRNVFRHLRRRF